MPFNDANTKLLLQASGDQSISEAEVVFNGGVTIKDFGGDNLPIVGHSTFLGGSSRLELAYSADFEFAGTFTVELYVMLNRTGQEQHLVSGQYVFGNYKGWCLYINSSNQLVFKHGSTTLVTSTTALEVDTWYHVAVSRDSALTLRLFLDGVSEGSVATATSLTADQGINIGDRLNYGDIKLGVSYKGYITAVNISSSNLYVSTFSPPRYSESLVNNSSTKLLLDFTEVAQGSTTTPLDTATSGAKTITGVSLKNCTFWWGKVYDFDGVDDYLDFGDLPGLSIGTGVFTISFWVIPGRDPSGSNSFYNIIFSLGSYSDMQLTYNAYDFSSGSYGALVQNGASVAYIDGLTLNIPYYVEFTRISDGVNVRGGLNGSSVSNSNVTLTSSGGTLGSDVAGGSPFKGALTDFHITRGAGHSANFTPPSGPSTKTADTRLLLQPSGDSSINTVNSVLLKSTSTISQESDANFNQSFKLNGTTDYLEIPDSGDFNFG